MKNIILISIFFILISCKKNEAKVTIENIKVTAVVDTLHSAEQELYSSEDLKKYYKCDPLEGNCILEDTLLMKLKDFTNENVLLPIKENDLEGRSVEGYKYFEVRRLHFKSGIEARLIIYNTYGDNDIIKLNAQLNSYKENQLVDQLMIDSRFRFENKYFRSFSILDSGKIVINKFTVETLLFSEDGDIIGDRDVPKIDEEKVTYVLSKEGYFIEESRYK